MFDSSLKPITFELVSKYLINTPESFMILTTYRINLIIIIYELNILKILQQFLFINLLENNENLSH